MLYQLKFELLIDMPRNIAKQTNQDVGQQTPTYRQTEKPNKYNFNIKWVYLWGILLICLLELLAYCKMEEELKDLSHPYWQKKIEMECLGHVQD